MPCFYVVIVCLWFIFHVKINLLSMWIMYDSTTFIEDIAFFCRGTSYSSNKIKFGRLTVFFNDVCIVCLLNIMEGLCTQHWAGLMQERC